ASCVFYTRFRIFEMDAANSSWIVKCQVDVNLNPYDRSSFGSTFFHLLNSILFIIESGEEKVVMLTKDGVVVYYDLKDMSFEKIYDLSARQRFPLGIINFYQYIESLACI
ncbi:hypothetical protein MKX03_018966, partial [Papaver bracteatum]